MIDRLKGHIERLFADAPATRIVRDAKEELLASCIDKYNDLIAAGKTPDEAFTDTIAGIGDVDELLGAVSQYNKFDPVAAEQNRKKRAAYISIAILLYIIAVASLILLSTSGNEEIGLVSLLLICGIATSLLLYGCLTSKTIYEKQDNTLVEDVKEQMMEGQRQPVNPMQKAIHSTIWPLVVIAYLAVSFLTGWWHITWVIFLLGAIISILVNMLYAPSKKRDLHVNAFIWLTAIILYFPVSFSTGRWDISWMIFLMAIAVQQIIKLFRVWKEQV